MWAGRPDTPTLYWGPARLMGALRHPTKLFFTFERRAMGCKMLIRRTTTFFSGMGYKSGQLILMSLRENWCCSSQQISADFSSCPKRRPLTWPTIHVSFGQQSWKKSGGLKKGDYKVDCRLAKADNINKASRSKADEQRTARRHSMKAKMKERANT